MSRLTLIFTVVVVSALFLFTRILFSYNNLGFDWDQERDAMKVREIVVDHNLTLIGPRALGPEGFFLGPYYFYLLVPFYILSGMHPVAIFYFGVFLALLLVIVMFKTLTKIGDVKFAIIFMLIWSLLSANTVGEAKAWNVSLIYPLIFGLIYLLQILSKYTNKMLIWVILGALLGLGVNFHVQFTFWIFITLIYLIKDRDKLKLNKAKITLMLCAFLTIFLPLLVFDIRNNWLNMKLLFGFFTKVDSGALPVNRLEWLDVLANQFQTLFYFRLSGVLILAVMTISIYCAWRLADKSSFRTILHYSGLFIIVLTALAFFIYSKRPSEYYFSYLFPSVVLALAEIFAYRRNIIYLPILVIWLLLANFNHNFNFKNDQFSLWEKEKAVLKVKEIIGDKKANVSFRTERGRDVGFQYLLEYHRVPQTGNFKDHLIEIVMPIQPDVNIKINDLIGIKAPSEWIR